MAARTWLRKRLPFLLCSSILLGIQCPPLVVDSLKTGVAAWVSGSFSTIDLTPFSDFLIGAVAGGARTGM